MEEVEALETRLVFNRWMAVAYQPPPPPSTHVRLFVVLTDYSFLSWIDLLTFGHFRMERTLAIGGSRGGTWAPCYPLIFKPTENFFLSLRPPPPPSLHLRVWMIAPPPPPPPPLSEGLDPPLLAVALGSSHSRKYRLTINLLHDYLNQL